MTNEHNERDLTWEQVQTLDQKLTRTLEELRTTRDKVNELYDSAAEELSVFQNELKHTINPHNYQVSPDLIADALILLTEERVNRGGDDWKERHQIQLRRDGTPYNGLGTSLEKSPFIQNGLASIIKSHDSNIPITFLIRHMKEQQLVSKGPGYLVNLESPAFREVITFTPENYGIYSRGPPLSVNKRE